MSFTPWVPTAGNSPVPLSVGNGGTGGQLPWVAADDGFLGSNSDPSAASGGGLLVATNLYMMRLSPRVATVVTNLFMCVSVVGVGATNGCFVGLYSAAGTLLSGSADVNASFTGTTGWKSLPLSTPQAVTAGTVVYAAVLCNLVTTQVTLLRQNNSVNADPQAVVTAATQRWGQFAAAGTTLPASLTMSSMAGTAFTNVVLWT